MNKKMIIGTGLILLIVLLVFLFKGIGEESNKIVVYSGKGDISVVVKGLYSDKGKVMMALDNNDKTYLSLTEDTYKGAIVDIKQKVSRYIFKDIPHGQYTVKFYHDKNSNGELDFTAGKIPEESCGFSNNVKGMFGLPSFDKAKFEHRGKVTDILINAINYIPQDEE